jgi:hypothetical protein
MNVPLPPPLIEIQQKIKMIRCDSPVFTTCELNSELSMGWKVINAIATQNAAFFVLEYKTISYPE